MEKTTTHKVIRRRNPHVSHVCKQCSTSYTIPFWWHKKDKGVHFCGYECYHQSLVGKPSKKRGSTWSEVQRKKCSGANASNWRGGVSRFQNRLRRTSIYASWRAAVFAKDDFTCQSCNVRGGTLNADHFPEPYAVILHKHNIKNYDDARKCEELWSLENGRTLCLECHKKTETYAMRFDLLFKRIGSTTFASATGNYVLY